MRIGIALCGGLGDELCLTPTYKALKEKYDCEITAVVKYRELLLGNPYVDHIYKYGSKSFTKAHLDKFIHMRWASGSYKKYAGMHLVDLFAMQAGVIPNDRKPLLKIYKDEYKLLPSNVVDVKNRPIITFDMGTAKDFTRWQSKYFRELLQYLVDKHNAITVQVGNKDYAVGVVDFNYAKHPLPIRTMAGLIHYSDLYIGCDSGAAHIASAVSTPSVKIFGPTTPETVIHNADREIGVVNDKISCQGCVNRQPLSNHIIHPKQHSCPNQELACLVELYPFKVQPACDELLNKFFYQGIRNINKFL